MTAIRAARPPAYPGRLAARLVFWALFFTPLAFLGVALSLHQAPRHPGLAEPLFWAALANAAVDVVLSRWLPHRMTGPASGVREAVAFARLVVAWALCEAGALFPVVAWLITGDPRLLGLLGVVLLALATLYPSDPNWEVYLPPHEQPQAPRPRGVER